MTGHLKHRRFAIVAGLTMAALATAPNRVFALPGCPLTAAGSGLVASVRDGRTLLLADGREVRLAGIEIGDGRPDILRALTGGQTLRLETSGPGTDRYGRLVAFAYLPDASQSVQETLLDQGAGLVSARIGEKACAAALFAAERRARTAGRGLWADPNFAPLSSENLPRIDALRGHFALVEGKVLSVRESGATIYMNFGRHWTRDFTVTILKRQQRTFAAAGVDVKKLEGRNIRVRGWIERRGGPIIEATAPEQIELIE